MAEMSVEKVDQNVPFRRDWFFTDLDVLICWGNVPPVAI
jgi:hypothetical protein